MRYFQRATLPCISLFTRRSLASTHFTVPRKASTIAQPVPRFSKTEIPHEERLVFSRFQNTRANFNNLLRKYLERGIMSLEQKDYTSSLDDFDCLIDLVDGELIEDLSELQKGMIASAHLHKAKILRIGDMNEAKLAFYHLEQALSILPDMKEAAELKEALVSDMQPIILPEM